MERKVIQDFVIPKLEGKAFTVKRGQILRVIETEGPQVPDLIAYNLHDLGERFSVPITRVMNRAEKSRKIRKLSALYSGPPRYNTMFRIIHDPVGVHHLSVSGGCSRLSYGKMGRGENHPNCQDILTKAIEPFGLSGFDLMTPIGIFMNVEFEAGPWGNIVIKPPPTKKGDYIDLLAEMDCLVAVSACPNDYETNAFQPKSVGIQILEGTSPTASSEER